MCVCLGVYVYVFVYVYMCLCLWVHVGLFVCVYVYIYLKTFKIILTKCNTDVYNSASLLRVIKNIRVKDGEIQIITKWIL